ncbi:unnamed protein product, partial [Discosporangium mesarthrocarpum]
RIREGEQGQGPGAEGVAGAEVRVRVRGAAAELRSVEGLGRSARTLSKLVARVPGLTASLVHLAVAQRVLCGREGGLSAEALGLLEHREDRGGIAAATEAGAVAVAEKG